ncbi:maleylpyruvate isomerase family mycothiol-dependent enzyme [Arthrobacter sp. H14]|uniref:maleylpyruvate isomerase family mycothiol-dependent enzyme n=1 Tax=Arthrobacter sp. H14 TaxID=1312959 RepID=UPI0004AFABE5|nr:maleylpyruvate isomerase family mycothiol-dependent enzyme [Arthrobacter sp. H14]
MTPTYPYALPLSRYRELMARDFPVLHEAAGQALTVPVPACPDWTGEDLARHTALVFLQKAETMRTGVKPKGRWVPEELLKLDALPLLEEGYNQVVEQFDAHDPADPAESWVPDDQTVGFWIRRLAHEASMHRHDAEAALDRAVPIDEELAIDGIDEVLTVMLGRGTPDESASGSTVVIESGGKFWSAILKPESVSIQWEDSSSPEGRVSGGPSEVLLWLWGRGPLPAGSTENAAVAELRTRLAAAT